jgi:hypothetical protein
VSILTWGTFDEQFRSMDMVVPTNGILQQDLPDDVVQAHSITAVPARPPQAVIVSGSHGGLYSAACALQLGVPAVLFNDAGGGLDNAGVAGLALLERYGVAAAAVSHRSARIGDASDAWVRGRIHAVNRIAQALGVRPGMSTPDACRHLPRAAVAPIAPSIKESRHALAVLGAPVHVLDSNSLVSQSDAGTIVITGSHGGLLGGDPTTAIKHAVFAAFYNDAGVGIDGAGTSRLPALDRRGIAAVTVDANTARIGDGLSTWERGIVSFVNARAQSLGVAPLMTVQAAVRRLAQAWLDQPREEQT